MPGMSVQCRAELGNGSSVPAFYCQLFICADEIDPKHETAVADNLLANLGRGAVSVADLQQYAASVVLETGGKCSSMTRSLARIGNGGKQPQNCERDLFRLLDLPIDACPLKSLRP